MPSRGHYQILTDLHAHRSLFDFTRDGLGADLLDIAADSHSRCLAGEHAPDGTRWTALSPAYAAWKARYFAGNPMAVLHSTMTDPAEVEGSRFLSPDLARYVFGTTEQAMAEAAWFEEGDPAANRPPRPFTGLDDIALQLSDDRLNRHHRDGLAP